jgi:hypothetical protein
MRDRYHKKSQPLMGLALSKPSNHQSIVVGAT